MRRSGLAPGNPDGSYVQRFELLGQRTQATASIAVGGQIAPLSIPEQAAFAVTGDAPHTTLNDSPLVFVGYGIKAPEYGWNDYADADVRGKTVLVLGGEPAARHASDTTRFDSTFFRGEQLTLHGTAVRKREVALAHGAAAIIIVTRGLGSFRNQIRQSRGEFITLGNEQWPRVIGYFLPAFTRTLFTRAGREFTNDSIAAGRRGFRAIALNGALSLEATTQWRRIPTRNVVARLDGSDPRLRSETILYTARWDAYGIGPAIDGDSIYNGAVDNAVGVGQMLAVAEALASGPRPRRSMMFIATSAEEPGPLLGAKYYVAHPLVPLAQTVATINFDLIALAGPTRDVTLLGAGRSTIDDFLKVAARRQGRTTSDPRVPDAETWFSLDHLPFAMAGVPVVSIAAGDDVIDQRPGYAAQRDLEYHTRDYHRPSDEVRGDWNWGSIVQDAQLGVLLGLELANRTERPVWRTRSDLVDNASNR